MLLDYARKSELHKAICDLRTIAERALTLPGAVSGASRRQDNRSTRGESADGELPCQLA